MAISMSSLANNIRTIVKANSPAINYIGRTMVAVDGSVSYDWVGVYWQTDFSGGSVAVNVSESGTSYHNIFIDGKFIRKIKITGKKDTLITLASGLTNGFHRLRMQKCTEGEFGCTSIHQLILAPNGKLKFAPRKHRMIEIYGDSYTCGYGSEGKNAADPFKLETENCNKTYGCILSRYFDADYALIAHSGRGVVRNYGDTVRLSKNTMSTRMTHVFDDHDASAIYDFKSYKPDVVLINLGTNDFALNPAPTDDEFINGYIKMIKQIRKVYGDDEPILCILPHSGGPTSRLIPEMMKRMNNDKFLFAASLMEHIVTCKYDMGASSHPNYSGHRKIAMTLIPLISAITGWQLETKLLNRFNIELYRVR